MNKNVFSSRLKHSKSVAADLFQMNWKAVTQCLADCTNGRTLVARCCVCLSSVA